MARNKVRLSIRVTASHLHAIGRVAAESSSLDTAMLKAISILSGVELLNVVILAGPLICELGGYANSGMPKV